MSKFKVTYPSGLVEETVQSDCSTIEQFANTKFGSSDYAANGVMIELVDDKVWPDAASPTTLDGIADQDDTDALKAALADKEPEPVVVSRARKSKSLK